MITRKRLLIAALVVVAIIVAVWFGGRYPLARWAMRRALAAAKLEPATFRVQSVGLGTLRVANLSVGAEPWLTARSVDVTFTPRDLLAARAGTIRLADARWTVHSRFGAIDWGYAPGKNAGTRAFKVPFDLMEVTDSTIRVIVSDTAHDVRLAGRLAAAGPGAAAGQIDLAGLGRTATLTAQLKFDDQQLAVEVDGHAEYLGTSAGDGAQAAIPADPAPAAPSATPHARWHAALLRQQPGGATHMDWEITLDSIAEQAGATDLALSHANITGHAALGADQSTDLHLSLAAQGLRTGAVTLQSVELKATKADGPQLALEMAAAGQGWALPAARGNVTWSATGAGTRESPKSTLFTAAMQTVQPVTVNFESAGITGLVESVTAALRTQKDQSGVHVLDGRLTLHGGSLQAGDFALSDAHAQAVMPDPQTIEVTSLTAIVGDGSLISAQPFTWNLPTRRVDATLAVSNLSIAHWLPIISSDHATGEGRISGSVGVMIDWSSGSAKLGRLTGSLTADPQHGFIQVVDAQALGELLEKQDPRFATDDVMRPVRDKIIAALRDFAFKKLTVDLSRQGDHTVALTYLSGFGRLGDDPQGLDLTLDLHVQDSFVDLASRIAAKSSVRKDAGAALEEFFRERPTGQEKP